MPALLLTGKQAIDGDSGATGAMAAALLGWPQATAASAVRVAEDRQHATVQREARTAEPSQQPPRVASALARIGRQRQRRCLFAQVDSGRDTVLVPLPAVVTCDLRRAQTAASAAPQLQDSDLACPTCEHGRLNDPRYAPLQATLRARKAAVAALELEELLPAAAGAAAAAAPTLTRVEPPPPRPPGVRLSSVAELAALLRPHARGRGAKGVS